MPLTPGSRLGPYEILAPLGAGGMGEVYRAHDTKLGREVAIKVLSAAMSANREQLARFDREAKVLASLNHPNIAQIYGLEESGETRALVMELVEGSILFAPQPLPTALSYARQIAEAVEAAHEKGITHRDLKPGNIMVTPHGVVKVLDFGLAAIPANKPEGDPANSPTISLAATQVGMIMGTAAYMSPEQAAGKVVDKRSDIWSFGVVLWEMITGKRLFSGESIPHTLAAVLTGTIEFTDLPSSTPAPIRDLVKRCLERDPRKRLRDIGEARLIIEKYLSDANSGSFVAPKPEARPAGKLPWLIAAALALTTVAAAWFAFSASRPAEPKPLVRLDVDLGADVSLDSPRGVDAILSPDGTRLIYVSNRKLFTRKLDQPKANELPGTESANSPFFSPDGEWVGFFVDLQLKKLSLTDGSIVVVCPATIGAGAAWGENGQIITSLGLGEPLKQVPAAGGDPVPLTDLSAGERTHRWPQILPGGKAVLFTTSKSLSGYDASNIEIATLQGPGEKIARRKTLIQGGTFGRYVATSRKAGHLLYVSKGRLFAVTFDPNAQELRGKPIPLLEKINYNPNTGSAQFEISGTASGHGLLIYRAVGGEGNGLVNVQWLDKEGRSQPLLKEPGQYDGLRLSPDGKRLALTITDGQKTDIWIHDISRDTTTRLTYDVAAGSSSEPFWTPDGRFIAFHGKGGIYSIRADGSGPPQLLVANNSMMGASSFTPDGKRLAWWQSDHPANNLYTAPISTDGAGMHAGPPEPWLDDAFLKLQARISPDGRWLAYTSNESGVFQIYVRAFSDRSAKVQISANGGIWPVWSNNGHELFFRSADDRIMVAPYKATKDALLAEQPKPWTPKRIAKFAFFPAVINFDLAPDGQRFVAALPVETPEAIRSRSQLIFLENFYDELRRKLP
jgi:serine/threonine protein kinase